MDCPSCSAKTQILETRAADGGAVVRRRRRCRECGRRFTSFERREPEPGWVRKRGGERQPFNAGKLRAGLARAAHKRPVSPAQLDAVAHRIELELEQSGGELSSEQIRGLCLEGLLELDAGAYMQFAGVELSDIDAVRAELARLGRDAGKDPANRGSSSPAFRPVRRGASGVTPKRRRRGDG